MEKITVTLCSPYFYENKKISYTITPYDNPIAKDWLDALENDIIGNQRQVRQNYNFLGFPNTFRNIEYVCNILNQSIEWINSYNDIWEKNGLPPYIIHERYSENTVVNNDGTINHQNLNFLHNHFETLRGTVWEPSPYMKFCNKSMELQIENLNFCCHELESLISVQYSYKHHPDLVFPSNIMTFLDMKLYDIKDEHRDVAMTNAFDRRFGEVILHWSQIGKRLDEVYRDENAPDLILGNDPYDIKTAGTQCEAINSLRYYCGGFDIYWGKDQTRDNDYSVAQWHEEFFQWVEKNGLDPKDPKLMLGYLPIGKVDVLESFGTIDRYIIWEILANHMKIYSIEYKNKQVIFS